MRYFKFQPFSRKQRMIFNWWTDTSPVCKWDGIIADGAIRSGKTLCMSLSFVMWAMNNFNGEKFGMAGKTIESFHRNVLSVLTKTLPGRGYQFNYRRGEHLLIVWRGTVRNEFYVFGGKDESSQDLVQGITCAGFFFDEVALMPESFVNQATARCSVDGSKLWFNCNPSSSQHWFKIGWVDKADKRKLNYLHFTMDDNLSLSEQIKERYRNQYTGAFYDRYIRGLWVAAEGVIYDMFEYEKHVVKLKDIADKLTNTCYVSCDYGTQNPMVYKLWVKGADNKWYCIREYYWNGREERKQKTDAQYVEDMKEFIGDAKPRAIIVDPSAASFITALKDAGLPVIKADNNVMDGIRFVSVCLKKQRIAYTDLCVDTLKEFGEYVWDDKALEKGIDQPLKLNDHCLVGDTLVDTIKGQVPIRDLVGTVGEVHCYDEARHEATTSVFYDVRKTQEQADVYRITTIDGRTIMGTAEHKIFTDCGWKTIHDLNGREKIFDVGPYTRYNKRGRLKTWILSTLKTGTLQ